jgi:hypothetical protein
LVDKGPHISGVVLLVDGVGLGAIDPAMRPVTISYTEIDAKTLNTLLPGVVILPLFGKTFDAIEALLRLERLGYRGQVIVRGPNLPNRAIVERELSAIVPALSVRLTGPIN